MLERGCLRCREREIVVVADADPADPDCRKPGELRGRQRGDIGGRVGNGDVVTALRRDFEAAGLQRLRLGGAQYEIGAVQRAMPLTPSVRSPEICAADSVTISAALSEMVTV